MKKRGLSPIIATVLLIGIVLALAAIVAFWARGVLDDSVEKEGRRIQDLCKDVAFDAEAFVRNDQGTDGIDIDIINIGNVPIYDVQVRGSGNGQVIKASTDTASQGITVSPGQTGRFEVAYNPGTETPKDSEVIIVPILLGETNEFKKAHVCDEKYAITTITKLPS